LAQDVIGFGTTVGSAVFNILFVIGVVNICHHINSGQPPRDPNPTQADRLPSSARLSELERASCFKRKFANGHSREKNSTSVCELWEAGEEKIGSRDPLSICPFPRDIFMPE
jgi:hypothetical protein